ncbi:MAG: L-2-amino-thiazoline-4-carboxylic acid hydrolase [Promethearchaeota archaeon]
MSNEKEKNYYVKKKRTLIRQFDAATAIVKDILIKEFGETKFKDLTAEARKEFEGLIPQIPYVGGKANKNTENLVNATILLPLLRIFEKEGMSFDEIGRLAYSLYEVFYKVIPQVDDLFSEEHISYEKVQAKDSKLRKYLGDWVFDFIDGDGKTFTWGVNYSECGVYKFYKSQGMEHLMPLVCIADYAMARAYGYGLKRTQTIGNGAPICDFRYVKDGTNPRAWPPDNLLEFRGK